MEIEYDAYVGDVGVEIILDVATNISGATLRQIKYKKPISGTLGTWSATEKTATSIVHVTQKDDLNEAGIWKLQAYVEKSTWGLHGEIENFKVGGSLG